jgi:hypothetical protein
MRVASYDEAHNQLDAIYASGRLNLPFEGVLLLGAVYRYIGRLGNGTVSWTDSRPVGHFAKAVRQ